MPGRCTAPEHFDDDHATATAGTARLAGIRGSTRGLALGVYGDEQQLTHTGDVVSANAFGQQAVVSDLRPLHRPREYRLIGSQNNT